nr:MAG TPA: hypothetical protein [Caudoviricetes sp.]
MLRYQSIFLHHQQKSRRLVRRDFLFVHPRAVGNLVLRQNNLRFL